MVSVSVCYVLSANGWKNQNKDSSFPAKENHNMEKALFDWPVVLQYDVKAKYGLISGKLPGKTFFHPSVTRFCICLIN